jgi:oxidase EvaA
MRLIEVEYFERWRSEQLQRSRFQCVPTTFSDVGEWSLTDGRLRHRTGGFFSILGIQVQSGYAGLDGLTQPMIDQPEIGILGCLTQKRGGVLHLLAQMKTEPGNVGVAQLAPTFQCTVSNYTGKHGGTPAPYLEWFNDTTLAANISDSCQSEQGSRFLGKRNRNMVRMLPDDIEIPADGAWRWLRMQDVFALLNLDHWVNTDARSVLACCDWAILTENGPPFSRWATRGGLGEDLWLSYESRDEAVEGTMAELHFWLDQCRARWPVERCCVPLERLAGWQLSDDAITPIQDGSFVVRPFSVQALDREVPRWKQPLIDSRTPGLVGLLYQRRRGVPHFLVQALPEAGNRDHVQFTASVVVNPGETVTGTGSFEHDLYHLIRGDGAEIRLRCQQAEEGGRFFQDRNDYLVSELPEDFRLADNARYRWMTLRQLSAFAALPGMVTNEGRSALASLLAFL